MTSLIIAILLTFLAGLSIPAGALISAIKTMQSFCLRYEIDSFISYFGGGALLAAITLVLVPLGMEHNPPVIVIIAFFMGSLVLWQVDSRLKKGGNTASQYLGMLLDYIPESIVLGALMISEPDTAYLLAALIALQNMPEGFASYIEMQEGGLSGIKIWLLFFITPATGPLSAWLGHVCFTGNDATLGILSLFCSGGILFLIFDDIAPKAHVKYHDFPAIGAVLGFLLGIIGTMIIH